ncbi:MAG: thioredoxin domain-containing protein [Sedimentisphaerales bacterium]
MMVGYVPGPFFQYGQTKLAESRHFDLGNIPNEVRKIKAVVPFSNPGREPLVIEKVNSPCPCFSGWDGDKEVTPDQNGVINIYFDKDKIESGHVSRFVRINTNDPANSEVKILFDLNVIRSPEEEDILSLRDEIQRIKSELQSLRKEIRQLAPARNTGSKRESVPSNKLDTNVYDVNIGSSPTLGPDNAPVTIVEFFDFQCPFCAKEYPKIKQIMAEYPGKIRVVFKHFPLNFHKQAFAVHAVTEFALRQKGPDAFWKLHDMIMADPEKIDTATLRTYAQKIGLDITELDKLWADEKSIAELLKADKELAEKCNVNSTPTIFINGRKLADRSLDGYRSRIKETLSQAK